MLVFHLALTGASFVLVAAVVVFPMVLKGGSTSSIFVPPYEFAQPWYLQALPQFFMFLPLLYLLCRFTPVLEMHDGHYRFSQILIATLATYLAFSDVYGSSIPLSKSDIDGDLHDSSKTELATGIVCGWFGPLSRTQAGQCRSTLARLRLVRKGLVKMQKLEFAKLSVERLDLLG